MSKKMRISELPDFDPTEQLKDEHDMAAYLTAVLEENDPALLAAALGDIARARGKMCIRDSYEGLGATGQTVQDVAYALSLIHI